MMMEDFFNALKNAVPKDSEAESKDDAILTAVNALTDAVSEKPVSVNITQQIYSPAELSESEKAQQLQKLSQDLVGVV